MRADFSFSSILLLVLFSGYVFTYVRFRSTGENNSNFSLRYILLQLTTVVAFFSGICINITIFQTARRV